MPSPVRRARAGTAVGLRFAGLLRAAGQSPTLDLPAGAHDWAFVAAELPRLEAFLEQGWQA